MPGLWPRRRRLRASAPTVHRPLRCLGAAAPLLALLVGCDPSDPRPNVIFVLVDTLRADFLTLYGSERPTSPQLAEFASESVVFENATSQSTCTFPSVNSILTSRHPDRFLQQPDGAIGIPDGIPTLAGILGENGYATYAVSASPIVRHRPSKQNPWGGFGAGFDAFDEACLGRDADCVNRAVLARLRAAPRPFFLYAHYMDPHDPYAPPPGFPRRFSQGYTGGKRFIARGNPLPIERMLYRDGPDLSLSPGDLEQLQKLYADEIAFFDSRFQELVAALREDGLLDRSIVLLASDHGEEFLEHEHIRHCRSVFSTLTWTPLVLRLPGGEHAGRRRALVQNVDLLPTLLDLVGIDWRRFDPVGTSLRPVIERDEGVRRFAFTLGGAHNSVRGERFKLVYDSESETGDLYDLARDPGETVDVCAEHRETCGELAGELKRWMGVRRSDGKTLQERLEALGYLE